ncbi:sulfatase [Planctomycetota bacterium]|nr:sulfatase [Planctomycetota bacterium]
MRILYIDIDSLRPDHLGCYGYHRDTSPNIDKVAASGIKFNNCYSTDVPCLPSRSALFAGRAGIHTGVINHGGVASQPFIEGKQRLFRDEYANTSWAAVMRQAGLHTAMISPFGERHSAWHWYAGFNEIHNTGGCGMERADEVGPVALEWFERNAEREDWFLHINLWDPHTPYRVPGEFEEDYKNDPIPEWYTEAVRQSHWDGQGPHSAREVNGYDHCGYAKVIAEKYPDQPNKIESMDDARRMFDGYDRGVKYADHYVGLFLKALEEKGVLEDTAVIISADHGENLGELNIYGDHQTADEITGHIPLIIRWPGVTDGQAGRCDDSIIQHYDMAAMVIEMLGQKVPENWDGVGFAAKFKEAKSAEVRDYAVISQGAWSCQRAVRFDYENKAYIAIRSFHDGYHNFPDIMLFNLTDDPHEQHDIAEQEEAITNYAMRLLADWTMEMMRTASHGQDPMWTVMQEGGSLHTRGRLPMYIERLKATGRDKAAEELAAKHPKEADPKPEAFMI